MNGTTLRAAYNDRVANLRCVNLAGEEITWEPNDPQLPKIMDDCVDHARNLMWVCRTSFRLLIDDRIPDCDDHGRFLINAIQPAMEVFNRRLKQCSRSRLEGRIIPTERPLRQLCVKLKRELDRIQAHWPLIDFNVMEAAMADYNAGRSKSVDEILDAIRRSNSGCNS